MKQTFHRAIRFWLLTSALIFSFGGATLAQEITGSINGTVKDANGGAISGATVTITDQAKGDIVVRTATTNEDGSFSAPSLQVGLYKITVEASNFKKTVKTDVKLDVGQRRTEEFALEAGNITESVMVEADAVAVNLSTPTVATTINGDQVRELSLNNRNFIQLVTLAPGVTNDLDDIVNTGTNNPETQVVNRTLISVNGARSTQNTFTVDGADITDRGSNLTIQAYPSVDSIGEFKVLRSLYPAESGRSGGGQINVVTRSGTDDFHGSLFEFVRNEKFNANNNNTINLNPATLNSFNALYGRDSNGKLRRRPFRYNNYGFTVGGPVYFFNFGEGNPGGIFRKYDKTYFFFSEEQRRDIRYPTLGASFAPDALLKQGRFPIPICLAATTVCTSTLDPNTPISSRVPTSNVAQQYVTNIFNKIPNSNGFAGGYQLSYPDRNVANFRQEIIKIDHQFSKKLSAFYRYERDKIPTQDADGTIGGRSGLPFVNRTESDSPGRTHTAQATYVISPKLIVEGNYSYGFGGIYIDTTGLIAKQNAQINVPLPYPSQRDVVPILAVGESFASLTGFSNYIDPSSKQNYSNSLTWILGNHTLKFGGIYSRYLKTENAVSGTNQGSFGTFNNSLTSGSVLAAGVTNNALNRSLQRFANFLQGNLATFTQSKLDLTADFRQKNFESYAQDEWRFRPNLTLYYGVRYSFFGSPIDKNGQLSNFVPSLFDPSQAPQVTGAANRVGASSNFCNGLIVNSQNYTTGPPNFNCRPTASPWGEHVYNVSKTDFAPRVGLAWDPFGKGTTAVRTGYGIYHEQIPISAVELFLINPPYQETCTVTNVSLDNPVPGGNCTAAAAATVASLRGITPEFDTPYMQHWSLDVQHQFAKKTIVSVGYYGSKGTHLIGFTELNELRPNQALNSQCATGANTLQTVGATTVPCLAAGTGIFTGTTGNTQLDQIRPYRGYRSLSILEPRYNSNYHSLQVSAQQRFSGASQFNLAYTFSKNLTDNQTSSASIAPQNTYDIASERGRATLDRRHVITINFIYEIPFFDKQEGFIGKALGGWQASSIASYATGLPFTATTSGYDPAGLGFISALIAGGRPNLLCDPNENAPHTVAQFFNAACFQTNPASTATGIANIPGTAGRGVVEGPNTRRFDFTLSKNLRFNERFRIQLRAEAFNVLNFTNYRNIGTNVTLTTFGQVTSFRDPRTLQFGAKFYF